MRLNLFLSTSILIFSIFLCSCSDQKIRTATGFKTEIDSLSIEIQFYSPEIVRIIKAKAGFNFEKNSLAVIGKPDSVPFSLKNNKNSIIATTEKLVVKLDKTSGTISFAKTDDEELIREKTDGSVFIRKNDIGNATYSVRQSFRLADDEFIYGLGQYQLGKMSQRNQTLTMMQNNKETVVPFFLSTRGYGIYWDNYSITTFSDSTEATTLDSQIGDCIDYYLMTGEHADGIISNMRKLTGQVPMMPYWTFGYWQSKERYKSQEETIGVVEKYRKLNVPIDGIIQDWQYWGDNYHWNAMEFLNPKFHDPQKMVDRIHDLNAHIIISCWASFGPETKPYEELKNKGMLLDFLTWPVDIYGGWPPKYDELSGVKVYDAYHPEARDIYWEYLNKGVFSLGMDGWWLDSSEPDHMNWKDEDFDNETYLGSFRRVRNAFPLVHVGGVASHQREASEDKRVFILTRSAFAGQQRYSANSWSGDVVAGWDVLRKQISAGLNFSLTGIPYWNSDIGGFFVWNFPGGYENKAYHEIYVRWMQFGAFCPMMRSHGTDTPRELWYFGKEGDWTYDALKKMIELRYALLPYIYSTAWQVTSSNSSMMRALVMDFKDDKNVLDIDNQYMFGRNILVCPVTEPMYVNYRTEDGKHYAENEDFSKVKTTDVYLPAGTKWFDFWTGEIIDGGKQIKKEAPIDLIPLFVKAGSIIPLGPQVQYANEKIGPLTIRVYPGEDATFTFYDDERDNYNYESGAYATIEMKWNDRLQTLTIDKQNGSYQGMPETREISVVKVGNGKGTGFPSEKDVVRTITYTGEKLEITL